MEKTVIIINGAGGVGKDTICDIVAMHYRVKTISSIDPIKNIAVCGGWEYHDKSLSGRKLLSDIKLAFVEYNDLPLKYLLEEYANFINDSNEILFVHIREPEEIEKFKSKISSACITLLIVSDELKSSSYGNRSDDDVTEYDYDYVYKNNLPLESLADDFMSFFNLLVS